MAEDIGYLEHEGRALIMFYFVSQDKPEFNQFADRISRGTSLGQCYATAWAVSAGYDFPAAEKVNEIMTFLRDYCKRNNWVLLDWLQIQM